MPARGVLESKHLAARVIPFPVTELQITALRANAQTSYDKHDLCEILGDLSALGSDKGHWEALGTVWC